MKMYAPTILEALTESLRTTYWFVKDLRSFLIRAGVPDNIIAALPWDQYKRMVAGDLVDRLSKSPETGMPILERLVNGLVDQDERFPHLARLDDGTVKVTEARNAVRRLKDLVAKESLVDRAERARHTSRIEVERVAIEAQERTQSLEALNRRFQALCSEANHQRRGLEFQDLLRDLFALHDLDPRRPYAQPGEQTDGSINLDGTVLLLEARWTQAQTDPREVREFRTKVHDKLDNTLGLLISMGGFTEEAVRSASGGGRMVVILMDGVDLGFVFQGLHDLVEVLRRKLRHAAEQGQALYRLGS